MVLVFTHIPFVVNHIINATPQERLQQQTLLFTTNHTDRTFFVWRLNSARPSHPGHSTILLRSEIPRGMCAKLRTVAASNNRDHASLSLLLLLARASYIMVLFFTHIPFVVNHIIDATPPERLQQYRVYLLIIAQFCFNRYTTTDPVWSFWLESKMLWQLTFFLLLQQWFSTISLKGAKYRLQIFREPHKKFYHKTIDTFYFILLY